ncbi:hypothetical protein ACVWZV_002875 [Bradyrhizobium sp. GM5.1]
MIRISTIFIAICMVLVAASLGLLLYAVAGISGTESAIVALTALTFLILYNAVSMRLRDRSDVGGQIADLSRGTADLARQVAEFGRRLATIEARIASSNSANSDRIQSVVGEINELGGLVRQLATTVSAHEDLMAGNAPVSAPAPVARQEPDAPLDLMATFEEERPAAPAPAPPPMRPAAPAIQTQTANPVQTANGRNQTQLLATLRNAIDENRIDIFLQPMVSLPQRKVRFYEAVTRLRDERDQLVAAEEFISIAEASGLIGRIDNMVMLRCVQVLRRLMVRNKEVGVFCNVAASTLGNSTTFAQYLDFLEANRALAPSLVLEFKQSTFRNLGPGRNRESRGARPARLPFLDRPCHRFAHRTARARRSRRALHQGAGLAPARPQAGFGLGHPPVRSLRPARPLRHRSDRRANRGRARRDRPARL